jgi:D-arabinose 1-dehydrogenase-like Zn-dependent alcohol dehydrogenase
VFAQGNVDVPDTPNDNEVLVKGLFCGLSKQDYFVASNSDTPVVPGSEYVGRVVKAGKDADFKEGDIVGVNNDPMNTLVKAIMAGKPRPDVKLNGLNGS